MFLISTPNVKISQTLAEILFYVSAKASKTEPESPSILNLDIRQKLEKVFFKTGEV